MIVCGLGCIVTTTCSSACLADAGDGKASLDPTMTTEPGFRR